jgi:hypothetical protein
METVKEVQSKPQVVIDFYTGNRTLKKLDQNRRPEPSTLCEACTNAVWIATDSPQTLKSYCKVLYQMSWTDEEQVAITHCSEMKPLYQDQDQDQT